VKEASLKRLLQDVRRVLNNPFWIPEISTEDVYTRIQDDHDGTGVGRISITFTPDGDAWVFTDKHLNAMRFRNFFGGGMSERTRNALMILAYAIKLDNEQKPQDLSPANQPTNIE
jgi:hypothetical protein